MKYMVMECFLSYCIVMDENGKFYRAANLHYEVGQTVQNPVLQRQVPDKAGSSKRITSFLLAAACILLLFGSGCSYVLIPYGHVTLSVNPQVRLSVNHAGKVVGLSGMNEDGITLIKDVTYQQKPLAEVANTLTDKAIELEYLTDGKTLVLTTQSKDKGWRQLTERDLKQSLSEHLADKGDIRIMTEAELTSGLIIPLPEQSGYSKDDYSSDTSSKEEPTSRPETSSRPESSSRPETSSLPETSSRPESSSQQESSSRPQSSSHRTDYNSTDYDPKTDYDTKTDYEQQTDYEPKTDYDD